MCLSTHLVICDAEQLTDLLVHFGSTPRSWAWWWGSRACSAWWAACRPGSASRRRRRWRWDRRGPVWGIAWTEWAGMKRSQAVRQAGVMPGDEVRICGMYVKCERQRQVACG